MRITILILTILICVNVASADNVHKISFGVDSENVQKTGSMTPSNNTITATKPNMTPNNESTQGVIDNETFEYNETASQTGYNQYLYSAIAISIIILLLVFVVSVIRYLYLRYT